MRKLAIVLVISICLASVGKSEANDGKTIAKFIMFTPEEVRSTLVSAIAESLFGAIGLLREDSHVCPSDIPYNLGEVKKIVEEVRATFERVGEKSVVKISILALEQLQEKYPCGQPKILLPKGGYKN